MKANKISRQITPQTARRIAVGALLALIATLLLLSTGLFSPSPTRQQVVAARGAQVMPFDLDRTTHVFQPQDNGGIQTVTANDPSDAPQIALIQTHLQEEADRFGRGDFGDPASIHGRDMPGLAELEAGAARIVVEYAPLSNGAQIRYSTGDPALIQALHVWFAAQRADHGTHAQPEMQH